jgi:hypothetical protein
LEIRWRHFAIRRARNPEMVKIFDQRIVNAGGRSAQPVCHRDKDAGTP